MNTAAPPTSMACFRHDLIQTYGHNYFTAACFPDSYRVDFITLTGKALEQSEDEIWTAIQSLDGLIEKDDNTAKQPLIVDEIERYLENSSVHQKHWAHLKDHYLNHDRKLTGARLKEYMIEIRVQGGVDYLSIFQLLHPTMKLPLVKLNTAQMAKTVMLFESDASLASLVCALRRPNFQRHDMSYVDEKYDADPDNYLPQRTGRYYKIWSRLTAKEKKERKTECILFNIAQHCVKSSAVIDAKKSLLSWFEDLYEQHGALTETWQNAWKAKLGYFDLVIIGPEANEMSSSSPQLTPDLDDELDNLTAAFCKVTIRNARQQTILYDILSVLSCLAAKRRTYTRQEIFDLCIQEYGLFLPTQIENQLYKAIDKLFL